MTRQELKKYCELLKEKIEKEEDGFEVGEPLPHDKRTQPINRLLGKESQKVAHHFLLFAEKEGLVRSELSGLKLKNMTL